MKLKIKYSHKKLDGGIPCSVMTTSKQPGNLNLHSIGRSDYV